MRWEIIDSGSLAAQENMDFDAALLSDLASNPRHLLRFYDWKNPSISHGHFIRPEEHLHLSAAEQLGVDIAKRPTGGGVICHFTDFTFSIFVPKESPYYTTDTLTNYCFVNKRIKKALENISQQQLQLLDENISDNSSLSRFCMAKPTVLDVMCGSLKASGGAQRRTRHGFLHQGTISLSPPDWEWLYKIIISKEVVDEMQIKSHYFPALSKTTLKNAIQSELTLQ